MYGLCRSAWIAALRFYYPAVQRTNTHPGRPNDVTNQRSLFRTRGVPPRAPRAPLSPCVVPVLGLLRSCPAALALEATNVGPSCLPVCHSGIVADHKKEQETIRNLLLQASYCLLLMDRPRVSFCLSASDTRKRNRTWRSPCTCSCTPTLPSSPHLLHADHSATLFPEAQHSIAQDGRWTMDVFRLCTPLCPAEQDPRNEKRETRKRGQSPLKLQRQLHTAYVRGHTKVDQPRSSFLLVHTPYKVHRSTRRYGVDTDVLVSYNL